MAVIDLFFILLLVSVSATYKLGDVEESVGGELGGLDEEQSSLLSRSVKQLDDDVIVPYKEGDDPEDYLEAVMDKNGCPRTKLTRMNLCAAEAKKYLVGLSPNSQDNEPYDVLENAKQCKDGEQLPHCTGSNGFTVLKKGDVFTIKPKNSTQILRVRQVCGYTFGVSKVSVKFTTPNGNTAYENWKPQKTPSTWYNFGCTVVTDFRKAKIIEIELSPTTPTFNLRDLFGEVCVLK